jgi:hypothetical protein
MNIVISFQIKYLHWYCYDTTELGNQNGRQNTEFRNIKFTNVSLNDVSRSRGDGDVRRCSVETAEARARIFKLLRSPGIDSKESIPPSYVVMRAYTITLFPLGS